MILDLSINTLCKFLSKGADFEPETISNVKIHIHTAQFIDRFALKSILVLCSILSLLMCEEKIRKAFTPSNAIFNLLEMHLARAVKC